MQVHNNLDDGIEFFGGTVSAKHVVLTGNADDSLDWTDGWQGNIQFLYIEQTDSADNVIEADNREENNDAMPRSLPTIANMSSYGKSDEHGLRLRRGTGLYLYNSDVQGSASCLRVDNDASRNFLGDRITFTSVRLGCAALQPSDKDMGNKVKTYVDAQVAANTVTTDSTGTVTPMGPTGDFFDEASYIGAFDGNERWTAGWTVPGSVNN